MKIKGAVCIVTGAGTGAGAACAIQFARKGGRAVVNYSRSEDEARKTVKACEAAGGEAIAVKADVASDADCRALAQAALDKWGRIDALINNAGITKYAAAWDLEALSAEDFQRLYAVNTIGPYQMIRACVPAMKAQGAGARGEHLLGRGCNGGGLVDRLRRFEGRTQRDDPRAGTRSGASHSGQRHMSRHDRDALAQGPFRRRGLR